VESNLYLSQVGFLLLIDLWLIWIKMEMRRMKFWRRLLLFWLIRQPSLYFNRLLSISLPLLSPFPFLSLWSIMVCLSIFVFLSFLIRSDSRNWTIFPISPCFPCNWELSWQILKKSHLQARMCLCRRPMPLHLSGCLPSLGSPSLPPSPPPPFPSLLVHLIWFMMNQKPTRLSSSPLFIYD